MYSSQYSQSADFGGQRSASSAHRNEYAPPLQSYGFSSSSLFTPGDPGGFVMPLAGPHLHQQPGGDCGPSPLGFINPNEHIGHHHGHHPPMRQQQWQQQPLGGPGGFVHPSSSYPAPSISPPVPQPQPQQQMMAYPPAPQPMYRQQQHAHGAESHGYPQRKSVHFLPPYSERDPHPAEASHVSTAVGYHDKNKRRDSVLSHSRPESVASRYSATSSLHTLVPNSPSTQMYATPSQVGMSVYNKHGGNLHPSSSPPRRHDMHNSRQAAYTWENLRYNN